MNQKRNRPSVRGNNSDAGSNYARRFKKYEEPTDQPLTVEEHRARLEAEKLEAIETIKRLRAKHDAHLSDIGERTSSVN
jgi:hypothetical protein